ncbi:MAG: hypothetical protein SF339_29725 [Blastocatellia bacterium]|nr:hypothetical protein [Blastocatellia bacterium]
MNSREALRHIAIIEARGDQPHVVFELLLDVFQGLLDLFLQEAAFVDRRGGEADEREVCALKGALDDRLPPLPGQDVFAVEPRMKARRDQLIVQHPDSRLIFARVTDEDLNLIHCPPNWEPMTVARRNSTEARGIMAARHGWLKAVAYFAGLDFFSRRPRVPLGDASLHPGLYSAACFAG